MFYGCHRPARPHQCLSPRNGPASTDVCRAGVSSDHCRDRVAGMATHCYFGAHRSRWGRGDLWSMGHPHRDKSGQTAMTNEAALWALRRTIAHEISHAMSGHRFTTTARQQGNELEADAKEIEYFFARGLKRGYIIDAEHDSKARYDQAQQLCPTV